MDETGGMRFESLDYVHVHLITYSYRLRVGVALLEEHNRTVLVSRGTEYVLELLRELLEDAEDATKAVRRTITGPTPEDGLGKNSRYSDDSGWNSGSAGTSPY